MAKEEGNPHLRAAMLEVVENQIRDGTPPETRETLDRLMREGHSRAEAIRLIACAVACEVHDVMKTKKEFQVDRFVAYLRALPRMPWDDEE